MDRRNDVLLINKTTKPTHFQCSRNPVFTFKSFWSQNTHITISCSASCTTSKSSMRSSATKYFISIPVASLGLFTWHLQQQLNPIFIDRAAAALECVAFASIFRVTLKKLDFPFSSESSRFDSSERRAKERKIAPSRILQRILRLRIESTLFHSLSLYSDKEPVASTSPLSRLVDGTKLN